MSVENTTPAITELQVYTVAQIEKPGFEPVTAGTRATKDPLTGKKKEIPADQRSRSILIPTLSIMDVPSKYQMFLLDGVRKVAKAQLSSLWEAEPMMRAVPANIWSVDALLMFAAREAESKRLTTASVTEWFSTSKLHAALVKKGNDKLLASWAARIVGLAATVLDYSEQDCTTILNMLTKFSDPDAEPSLMEQQLVSKLNKRLAALRKQLDDVALEEFEMEEDEQPAE